MASSIGSWPGATCGASSRRCSATCGRWPRRAPVRTAMAASLTAADASIRSGSSRRSRIASCRTSRSRPMVDRVLRSPRAGAPKPEPKAATDPKAEVWRRVQLARNLGRPRTLELLQEMADELVELHGDRLFGDDPAIVTGFARLG